MTPHGYDRILGGLYQGSAPPKGTPFRGDKIDTIVLCAMEYQPHPRDFPDVEVLRVALDDSGEPVPKGQVESAVAMAGKVSRRLAAGKSVLVTCMQGRNRSGLVSALALRMLGLSHGQAIKAVRQARGPTALSNHEFVKLIYSLKL